MFTMIKNLVNEILTWGEKQVAFYEGYTILDRINVKLDMDYIINGENIDII